MADKTKENIGVNKKKKEDDLTSGKRILKIYDRLIQNKHVGKKDLVDEFKVSERTIERNIGCINEFLHDKSIFELPPTDEEIQEQLNGKDEELWEDDIEEDDSKYEIPVYQVECHQGAYGINRPLNKMLKESEAYAIIKMLLECRGLNNSEITHLYDRIIECCVPEDKQAEFKSIILREAKGYKGPMHNKPLVEKVWDLQKIMRSQNVISLNYIRNDGKESKVNVMPVSIMFNEYYFYLLAYTKFSKEPSKVKNNALPIVYRIDRITAYTVLNDKFKASDLPITKEKKESDFRQHMQFMYIDKLQRVIFTCTKDAEEANLDRLPAASVLERHKDKGTVTISAIIYGKEGMDMWLRSQGDKIIECRYVDVPSMSL